MSAADIFQAKSVSCCKRVGNYLAYALSTSGRRMLTMLDVATDLRTFFLLWYDPDATIAACFLLACMSTPFLVYWASSHNFNQAIIAHRTFGMARPRNCHERCHRRFYNAMAVPLLGVYLTSLQIVVWWVLDVVMGIFCQSRHREELDRLEMRRSAYRMGRTMPLLMPPSSAKFLTVVELFYESIPQSILQLFVFFTQTSSHFKVHDVALSVGASLANTVLNLMEIQYEARTRCMHFTDYLLYFMSGQIDEMLESGIPVRRALRNASVDECDLTGFKTLWANADAMKNVYLVAESTTVEGSKRIVLPAIPTFCMEWNTMRFKRMVSMVLALRRHEGVHVTLPDTMVPERFHFLISPAFRQRAVELSAARKRRHCEVRAARCLNRCCGCCGTHPGDAVCATNTHVLDDDLRSVPRPRRRGCLGAAAVERRRSVGDNVSSKFLPFFRSWVQPVGPRLARRVLVYLVVGDLELMYHALRGETGVHSHLEHVLQEVEKLHGVPNGGAVPEREVWSAQLRCSRVIL